MKSRLPLIALAASVMLHLAAGFFRLSSPPPVEEEESLPVVLHIAEPPPPQPETKPEEPVESEPLPKPVLQPTPEPPPEKKALEVPEPPPRPATVCPSAPSSSTAPTPAVDPAAMDIYAALVRRQIIEKRRYPTPSRRREEEGTVLVSFSLNRRGELIGDPQLQTPCRFPRLNNAALKAVINAAPFPRRGEDIHPAVLKFQIPIRFSLRN